MVVGMRKSKLVADTTREEREAIVEAALGGGDDCDGASAISAGVAKMYQPYIDGEMELFECNMAAHAESFVQSDHGRISTTMSCMAGM